MSQILNCGLDQRTLSILASLVENGVNPEALAAVVKELKRESDALKVSLMLTCRRHKARELIIIKMLKTTFIARASDGLILCETYDIDTNPQSKSLLMSQSNDLRPRPGNCFARGKFSNLTRCARWILRTKSTSKPRMPYS